MVETGGVEPALERVASIYSHFLSSHEGEFACMRALENRLPVPRVNGGWVPAWCGYTKRFPQIYLLVKIITNGVPVVVNGDGDLSAALQYGNHRLVVPYEGNILCKIADDVRLGRSFVFPRETADRILVSVCQPQRLRCPPRRSE